MGRRGGSWLRVPAGRKRSRRKEVRVDGALRSQGIWVWLVPAEILKHTYFTLFPGGNKSKVMVWEASAMVL